MRKPITSPPGRRRPEAQTNARKILFWCIMLFLLAVLLYANTLNNEFAFDDSSLIGDNRFVRDGASLTDIFTTNYRYGSGDPRDALYRPLVILSFVWNAGDTVLDPQPFHLWNVANNALNSVLLFLLLYALLDSMVLSGITALLFTVHPLHTEVVANIAGRPELMYVTFILIAWLLYLRIRNLWVMCGVVGIMFWCGLLSKETAIVFPFMVIAADYVTARPFRSRRTLAGYLSLLLITILYIIVRWRVLGETAGGEVPDFYNNPIALAPFGERISTALAVLVRYAELLIAPVHLSSDYSYHALPLYSSPVAALPLLGLAILFGLIAGAFLAGRKHPEYGTGVILFLLPYLVISNFYFRFGTIMGERLMYLPSAGYSLGLAGMFVMLARRHRPVVMGALAFLFAVYGGRTILRNPDWRNDATITAADVKTTPDSVKLLFNMGNELSRQGRFDQAIDYYQRAITIYPDLSEAYRGIGKVYYTTGAFTRSVEYYRKAFDRSPDDITLYFDYAAALIKDRQYTVADSLLTEGIGRFPNLPLLYRAKGNLMLDQGRYREAAEYYQEALDRNGDRQILLNNIVLSYYMLGDTLRANQYLDTADSLNIPLQPDMVRAIRSGGNER